MPKRLLSIIIIVIIVIFRYGYTSLFSETKTSMTTVSENTATATFAGGCFRCIEPAYQEMDGVIDVVVGYAGGDKPNPTYEEVASGQTTYRESVQVTYNPTQIDYRTLVETLFRYIDPTDDGGQFVDRGYQYTTAIFYRTDKEKLIAEAVIAALDDLGKYDMPIVTKVTSFTNFYVAEEYHQDFYKKSSQRYQNYKDNSGRKQYFNQ